MMVELVLLTPAPSTIMGELFILCLGLVILLLGGEALVRGAVAIASRLGIAPLIIGLTVVSFGTSAPELLVSLQAALNGSPELALGNVTGSNLVNISLILGITVLIFPVAVARETVRLHWPMLMLASVLMVFFLSDGVFGRFDGLVSLTILISYIVYMLVKARREGNPEDSDVGDEGSMKVWLAALFLVLGILGLAFGADKTVEGAVALATRFGVSEKIIGLTVVAFGTSLPELVASIMAAFRKNPDISVGNLVGSNIFNILLILGATSLVKPITLDFQEFKLDLWFMLGVTALLLPLMILGKKLGRWQGLILLAAYTSYVIFVILPSFQ